MRNITQQEKETYLASLSEQEFRDRVVRRLFKRLGFVDGRDLCGPEERGKDSVFFEEDRFGVRTLVSVQTKRGSINLAADSTKNLHDIRAQLRTALESPYNCVQYKAQYFSSKLYLVASGKINEAARTWITNNLDRDPRVQYLDRDDLITNLDQHCPEVWLDITADVFPYLNALARLVDEQGIVGPSAAGIAGLKSYYAASDRAFVDLKLIKSVSAAKKVSGKIEEEFKFEEGGISTLLTLRSERLLLLGDAGSGKSTLLVRAAYMMAREGAAGRNDYRVPVILRASEISEEAGSILDSLERAVRGLTGRDEQAFDSSDLDAGRVVLLIDGLDEIALDDRRNDVVDSLNRFFDEYPRCSIILTTRPYSSIEGIPGVRGFTRCRISPMSFAGAEKMVAAYSRTGDNEQSRELLRRIDGIHGIELSPLLVTVLALTSDHQRRDIPANITELFSKFTELMLGRWDESKGVSQQFQARVKDHLICQFSFKLHADRKTQFERAEFEEFAITLLKAMNHHAGAPQMIEEIVVRSGLLRHVGTKLEFRHHLIQEFFAGRGIPGIEAIKALVADEWWRNPIVFFFGTNPDDVQSLLDVATSVSSSAPESCLTIGLALQTCYLSTLEEKVDVWKWVVETLAIATERALEDMGDEKFPLFHFLTHYVIGRDAVALSGVENEESGALNWAGAGTQFATDPQFRRFWSYVALTEIGRLDLLETMIKKAPLENDHLNLALFFGCRMVEVVRSVKGEQKEAAKEIRRRLSGRVGYLQHQFAKEYRGQLLEYRRGGIVALDQEESADR